MRSLILVGVVPAVLLVPIGAFSARGQDILLPRIINGQPTDEYQAVGIVGSTLWSGFATGTLISPTHVLTAAHAAAVISGPTSGIFEVGGQIYQTVAVHIHPDYNSHTLANDIAILELAEPVAGIAPAELFLGIPQAGDPLVIVGYGASGDAGGEDGTFGVKLAGTTTIDEVTATRIIWTFDTSDEANTAPGDSGGPGFLEVGGELFVASVTSAGTLPDAGLGDVATNTRVDAFADWILAVVTEATPDADDGSPPEGEECAGHGHRPGAFRPAAFRPSHRPAFGSRPGTRQPSHDRPGRRPHRQAVSGATHYASLATGPGVAGPHRRRYVSIPESGQASVPSPVRGPQKIVPRRARRDRNASRTSGRRTSRRSRG